MLGTGTRVPGYPSTRSITRYPGTRSLPGYPNTDRVFLLPVCCPLHSALMAANLAQSTTYLTNLNANLHANCKCDCIIQYQTTSCGVAYLHNQLRQLQQAVRSLSEDASKTLV